MTNLSSILEGLDFIHRDGKTFVKVSRRKAAALRRLLVERDIGATVHIDPSRDEWLVEPWTNLSAEQLRAVLTEGTAQPTVT
jgi:hypothetical protein